MKLQFIGSGDAFGSGGRFNTCFHVTGNKVNFLIDIGASSLIGLKQCGVRPNIIQAIFITHFHADHCGGIPFFMLDAQLISKRTRPLTIVGPHGLSEWYERIMEAFFPGSSRTKQKFDIIFKELMPRESAFVAGVCVTPYQACHGDPGGPFFGYRYEAEDKIIAYTGDTEWTNELIALADHADLLIAEGYTFEEKVKYHLNLKSLEQHLNLMKPKRFILTHMSDDMLARLDNLPFETASDGLVIEF